MEGQRYSLLRQSDRGVNMAPDTAIRPIMLTNMLNNWEFCFHVTLVTSITKLTHQVIDTALQARSWESIGKRPERWSSFCVVLWSNPSNYFEHFFSRGAHKYAYKCCQSDVKLPSKWQTPVHDMAIWGDFGRFLWPHLVFSCQLSFSLRALPAKVYRGGVFKSKSAKKRPPDSVPIMCAGVILWQNYSRASRLR